MIRRTNKIIQVLVAATIISLTGTIQPNAQTYPRMKFGESWYSTNYYGYTVYTDSKENYIDADYNLGEIK